MTEPNLVSPQARLSALIAAMRHHSTRWRWQHSYGSLDVVVARLTDEWASVTDEWADELAVIDAALAAPPFTLVCPDCDTGTPHRFVLLQSDRTLVQCLACAATHCLYERPLEDEQETS